MRCSGRKSPKEPRAEPFDDDDKVRLGILVKIANEVSPDKFQMLYRLAASARKTSSALSGSPDNSSYEGKLIFYLYSQTTLGNIPTRPNPPVTAHFSWNGSFQPVSNTVSEGSSILLA